VRPLTFAHRGGRPDENTIGAFRRSLEQGARGLESDARLSGDGEVVLVHDAVVRRGLVHRLRVEALDAAALAPAGVPRLVELYETLGSAFELSIDVKDPAVTAPILALAEHHDALERLWLCSPVFDDLRVVRAGCPGVRLVHSTRIRALGGQLERHAADLAEAGVDVMNLHRSEWTAGLVGLFHRFHIRAFAWDVQEVRHMRAVLAMGLDGLYSDHVERMVATVGEWSLDG
jgi:glycerophosphoryl diester phosphodiesterase